MGVTASPNGEVSGRAGRLRIDGADVQMPWPLVGSLSLPPAPPSAALGPLQRLSREPGLHFVFASSN